MPRDQLPRDAPRELREQRYHADDYSRGHHRYSDELPIDSFRRFEYERSLRRGDARGDPYGEWEERRLKDELKLRYFNRHFDKFDFLRNLPDFSDQSVMSDGAREEFQRFCAKKFVKKRMMEREMAKLKRYPQESKGKHPGDGDEQEFEGDLALNVAVTQNQYSDNEEGRKKPSVQKETQDSELSLNAKNSSNQTAVTLSTDRKLDHSDRERRSFLKASRRSRSRSREQPTTKTEPRDERSGRHANKFSSRSTPNKAEGEGHQATDESAMNLQINGS